MKSDAANAPNTKNGRLSFAGLCQLLRLQALGGTAHWPLLALLAGGSVAAGSPDAGGVVFLWAEFAIVLFVCLCFNTFGYLMNDLADADIDRLDPARQSHPLQTGHLGVGVIKGFMWLQLPLLVVCHQAGGLTNAAGLWLGLSVACLGVYNQFSKVCRWPLVMDMLLGCAGAALALFGGYAFLAPENFAERDSATLIVFAAAAFTSLVMINGFHNNLRDLSYEQASPRITTAKVFGARLDPSGAPVMGQAMAVYGVCLQLALGILAATLCALLQVSQFLLVLVLVLSALTSVLFLSLVVVRGKLWQRLAGIHLLAFPLPLMLVWLERAGAEFAFAVACVYFAPPLLLLANREAWRVGRIAVFAPPERTNRELIVRNSD